MKKEVKKIKKIKEVPSKIKKVEEIKVESKLEKEVKETQLEQFAEFIGEGEKAEEITPVIRELSIEQREIEPEQRPQKPQEEQQEQRSSYEQNPYLARNLRTSTGGEAPPPRPVDYMEYSPVMRTTGGEATTAQRNFGGEAQAPVRAMQDNRIEVGNELRRDYVESPREEKKKRRWLGEN